MSKFNYPKKVLVIDGNYFAHRIIHGVRITQPDFTLDTQQQRFNFESMLNQALVTIYKSFNNDFHKLINNVVFVFDHHSWRKDIKYPVLDADGNETGEMEYLRPYYIDTNDTETLLGYKDNRKELKKLNDINWEMFDMCLDNFRTRISTVIACLHNKGSEGDDNLFFITNLLAEKNYLSIIFATDGDLRSTVNNNVIYLKNVKSKQSPDGEFVISDDIYKEMFEEKSIVDIMLGAKEDMSYFETLFKIDISNGGTVRSNKVRVKETNIYKSRVQKDLLIKVICGDKKDNILPIFRWTSKGRNYKPTEKMLEKAFAAVEAMDFNEENVAKCFADKALMSRVLVALCDIVDQPRTVLKSIAKHYYHNLKLNDLSFESIPKEVYTNFLECYYKNEELINQELDIMDIQKLQLNVHQNDSAKDLIVSSIKDGENTPEVNPFDILKPQASSNPLVNDILNS